MTFHEFNNCIFKYNKNILFSSNIDNQIKINSSYIIHNNDQLNLKLIITLNLFYDNKETYQFKFLNTKFCEINKFFSKNKKLKNLLNLWTFLITSSY